ncbi:PH domain-containing protein [Mycena indigotica]|uniref:PH domain-containing protein n=1 Tax=Mycena indigotica TaxID=2126181 RepID=A0A8H6TAP7_9AGAR|nr:PH domain-containing protein [Mycena indigotica]KAF7312415.1 PH domain-containing protein [Mycena indigotica]
MDQSQRRPGLTQESQSHNRSNSSSFFSFNRRPTNNEPPTTAPQRSTSFLSRSRMEQQQQQSPPPQHQSRPSLDGAPQTPLHPEIRSVVQLTTAHARKVYYSGPLIRRVERQPDGQKPHKDEGWTEVWGQLNGTTLSIWDMKAVQEASANGTEVPPSYLNITDAFVHVLGAVSVPATPTEPQKRYPDVLTVNTGGSNLILFSCPSTQALLAWAAALRLSAWEKSRLEEIYTAHLLRITLSGPDHPSTLINGRMEGWVRLRIAGQVDWKKVWMSVSASADAIPQLQDAPRTKKRMSNLFSSKDHAMPDTPLPPRPIIAIYPGPKPKERKKAILTIHTVSQAFAVYPERPELISRSTLIKLEGLIGDEDTAGEMARREGWLLIMPELEGGLGQAEEMLKWIVALHDAFRLYGRPEAWNWDPRNPRSLMFGYPVGPSRDQLFLKREQAETLDPRDDRTSSIRGQFSGILGSQVPQRVPPPAQAQRSETSPSLPPLPGLSHQPQNGSPLASGPQLPPLTFGSENASASSQSQERNHLSPISERSSGLTAKQTMSSVDSHTVLSPQRRSTLQNSGSGGEAPPAQQGRTTSPVGQTLPTILDNVPLTQSPTSSFERVPSPPAGRTSIDSPSAPSFSRVGSGLSSNSHGGTTSSIRMVPQATPAATVEARSPSEPINRAINHSPTSVLTSPHSVNEQPATSRSMSMMSRSSVLTSPFSNSGHVSPTTTATSSITATSSFPGIHQNEDNQSNNISNEAGALYYMQQFDSVPRHKAPPRQQPTTISEGDDESESEDDVPNVTSTTTSDNYGTQSPVLRQTTPMAFHQPESARAQASSPSQTLSSLSSSHAGNGSQYTALGRKPSGARAPNPNRGYRGPDRGLSSSLASSSAPPPPSKASEPLAEEDSQSEDSMHHNSPPVSPLVRSNDELDALAALSYLDVNDEHPQPPPPQKSAYDGMVPVAPLRPHVTEKTVDDRADTPPSEFKSSFAPSKQAAERKAKIEAQQAAQNAAAHRPGRANGKRRSRMAAAGGNGWGESSDEEEDDEEDEEDEDVDSDGEIAPPVRKQLTPSSSGPASVDSFNRSGFQNDEPQGQAYSHLRPPRTLPQPPPRSFGELMFFASISVVRLTCIFFFVAEQPDQRRIPSDPYSERRTYLDDGTQLRSQAEMPQPGAARQSMWSQVLDPGRNTGQLPSQNTDTFVQLEDNKLTKAFTPQGLLSAGMQDKADRSAKRQEEMARESGASLINVPHKPPPPQTGLLGAITAHERERKREGGVGAALTEREREKRVAEDRQRRFDEHQRQQLDQMQQGGSVYSGQFPPYNPMMMMNPMMMGMNPMMPMMTGQGMNPMMTGQGMNPMMIGQGMNPMMTGQMGYPGMFNPQQMFAAQQAAAQAYQQAMVAFSTAGSQVGGDGGGGGAPSNNTPSQMQMNPMMGGNMGMFDPRMSMMGMPMMTPQMGLPMQMTGMSQFDPRFGPGNNGSPDPPLVPHTGLPNQYPSRTSSPARGSPHRGSPLMRPVDRNDTGGSRSRPTSPKP